MVSVVVSSLSGPVSSPGWGHCVVFSAIQWGVEILLVTSCHRNQGKLWPDRPTWLVWRLYLLSSLPFSY